jgi:hypothetical protein
MKRLGWLYSRNRYYVVAIVVGGLSIEFDLQG